MISIDAIINLLILYQLFAIFIGSFLFGETVIITSAFLAGQEFWSIANVFWLSLIGTVASDSVWFFLGPKILSFFQRWEKYKAKSEKLILSLKNITGEKPFLYLLFIKFLYGTRILTIIYLSTIKMRFSKFILFDTIGTIFWLAVIIPIGWLAGRGIINFIPIVSKFEFGLLFLILIIFTIRLTTKWLSKKITKE